MILHLLHLEFLGLGKALQNLVEADLVVLQARFDQATKGWAFTEVRDRDADTLNKRDVNYFTDPRTVLDHFLSVVGRRKNLQEWLTGRWAVTARRRWPSQRRGRPG